MEIVMLHCLGKNKKKDMSKGTFSWIFFMLLVEFWDGNL